MTYRVFFFAHSRRSTYLHSFLKAAKERAGWEFAVPCPENSRRVYQDTIAHAENLFFVPDFSRRAAWEDDALEHERIAALVTASENRSGMPVNRVVLAGERNIGRAFGRENYLWPSTRLSRAALRDPDAPAAIVRRIFKFVDDAFARFEPDFVLLGHAASPIAIVAVLVAGVRGLPYIMGRQSKILSNRCYWTRDREMYNDQAQRLFEEKARAGAAVSAEAEAYLKTFRESPRTVHYIAQNWKNSKHDWLRRHVRLAYLALARANHVLRRRTSVPPLPVLPKVFEYYQVEFLRLRQRDLYRRFTRQELACMRYIYYPMHKEPELAINMLAPLWHNQKNTVAYLSALLPHGYKLLVREHRFNVGRRRTRYLKDLRGYPGVELVDPYDSQFKYIENADLIVTDNGSTGWEGILFDKPVITLARTFYDAPNLACRVRDPSRLGQTILRLLNTSRPERSAEDERRLGWLVDAELETTVPEDETSHDASIAIIVERLADEADEPASLTAKG